MPPSSSLRTGACFLLLAVVCSCLSVATARADDGATPPALTALEAGPYRQSDAVVLGRVVHVTDVRAPGGGIGRQVARVQVERTFKGALDPETPLSVTVQGHRPTLNPDRPSIPYFRAGEEQRYVLFLVESRTGATYQLRSLYDAQDAVGEEKIAAVMAVAEVAGLSDTRARERKMVAFLSAGLKASGRWTKAHAARELAYLARVAPRAIDAKTEARIRRLPPAVLTPDQRYWLRVLFRVLDEHRAGRDGARPEAPGESDPWRATFRETEAPEDKKVLLARLAGSGRDGVARHGWWAWRQLEPSLREWFARTLGERAASSAAALRTVYAGEEETEVRAAIVRAVGQVGRAPDVPWLAARLGNLALRRTALLALARVRTPAALERLGEAREAAEKRGEADLVAWIEHLLSDAFQKSDAWVRKDAGTR